MRPSAVIEMPAGKALSAESALIVVLGSVALLDSPGAALSAVIGGVVSLLPNAYFAVRALRRRAGESAVETVRRIYIAEFTKLAWTTVLFAVVFVWITPPAPGWFFAGFIGAHAGYLLALATAVARR